MKILPFTTDLIDHAIAQLTQNKAVILPTDTIYGLHLPFLSNNLCRLNKIKQRPQDQPCNVIYVDVSQITALGTRIELDTLAKLNNIAGLSTIISSPNDPRGQSVRMITNEFPILRELLIKSGPLYSTSANVSGETYISNIKYIAKTFDTFVELAMDNNVSRETYSSLAPSTIIDLRTSPFHLVREGKVTRETIDRVLHM